MDAFEDKLGARDAASQQVRLLTISELQKCLKEALYTDSVGCPESVLYDISQATYHETFMAYISKKVWGCIKLRRFRWRRIQKALVLLNYLALNGSEVCIREILDHTKDIVALQNSKFWGSNVEAEALVQEKAAKLLSLVRDTGALRAKREHMASIRDRFVSIGLTNGKIETEILHKPVYAIDTKGGSATLSAPNTSKMQHGTNLASYQPRRKNNQLSGANGTGTGPLGRLLNFNREGKLDIQQNGGPSSNPELLSPKLAQTTTCDSEGFVSTSNNGDLNLKYTSHKESSSPSYGESESDSDDTISSAESYSPDSDVRRHRYRDVTSSDSYSRSSSPSPQGGFPRSVGKDRTYRGQRQSYIKDSSDGDSFECVDTYGHKVRSCTTSFRHLDKNREDINRSSLADMKGSASNFHVNDGRPNDSAHRGEGFGARVPNGMTRGSYDVRSSTRRPGNPFAG